MDRLFQEICEKDGNKLTFINFENVSEEQIFDDSVDCNTDIEDYGFQYSHIKEEDIFEEKASYTNYEEIIRELKSSILVLECDKLELEKENIKLYQELNKAFLEIQTYKLSKINQKNQKAPAYRSDINLEKLITLWNEGVSLNRISRQLGCSPHTVKKRLLEIKSLDKKGV